jgi:hypothetical protein
MSIDQEEQNNNQFFVTTKFFKTGQMTICLQNLLFQNQEFRAGADVFRATLSKNLIHRYSDKHYLKKDDDEEKKTSSHSSKPWLPLQLCCSTVSVDQRSATQPRFCHMFMDE